MGPGRRCPALGPRFALRRRRPSDRDRGGSGCCGNGSSDGSSGGSGGTSRDNSRARNVNGNDGRGSGSGSGNDVAGAAAADPDRRRQAPFDPAARSTGTGSLLRKRARRGPRDRRRQPCPKRGANQKVIGISAVGRDFANGMPRDPYAFQHNRISSAGMRLRPLRAQRGNAERVKGQVKRFLSWNRQPVRPGEVQRRGGVAAVAEALRREVDRPRRGELMEAAAEGAEPLRGGEAGEVATDKGDVGLS
eukprot:gene9625-biopygen6767